MDYSRLLFCLIFILFQLCYSQNHQTGNPHNVDEKIVEKFSENFVEQRLNKYNTPDYDLFERYNFYELVDSNLCMAIYHHAMIDSYEAKTYLYSIENRLTSFQDFTVFITNSYSYNIVYCIFDNENKLISTLTLAYQLSEGEYSEYGEGEFYAPTEYRLKITEVTDPYEDMDGRIYDGTETLRQKQFFISEEGEIVEI